MSAVVRDCARYRPPELEVLVLSATPRKEVTKDNPVPIGPPVETLLGSTLHISVAS